MGAALAAARSGATVILVEKRGILGGTSTAAYVCRWEPGPGCAFAREIYDRLAGIPETVGIARRVPTKFGALLRPDASLSYEDSLRRAGVAAADLHAVVFEPAAYHRVVSEMLAGTGKCRVLLETTFTEAETRAGRIEAIRAQSADGSELRITAQVFVDCTGGGHLCRQAGCEVMLGAEDSHRFGEPDAPEKPGLTLNAISLCYRVTRRTEAATEELPPSTGATGWQKVASVHELPNGDRIVNPLGLLSGRTLVDVGYARAYDKAKNRAAAHWRWLRAFPEFEGYRFHRLAPLLGIRESHRVVTRYVLTEHDLIAGLDGQQHADIIALADHPMDTHGQRGGLRAVNGVYGIPYRCLVPQGLDNVLVAGRGAGFSHIAASSCRLSRTMLALGHAAGLAAAEAARDGKGVECIDVSSLVRAMAAT